MGLWKIILEEKRKLYAMADKIKVIPKEYLDSYGFINVQQIHNEIEQYG